jgi:hypothetical protein
MLLARDSPADIFLIGADAGESSRRLSRLYENVLQRNAEGELSDAAFRKGQCGVLFHSSYR